MWPEFSFDPREGILSLLHVNGSGITTTEQVTLCNVNFKKNKGEGEENSRMVSLLIVQGPASVKITSCS
jgi:hypothetical protein